MHEKHEVKSTKVLKEHNTPLLSQEILKKISQRVLSGVPSTEKLRRIQKMGILRVGLPPIEKPFQSIDEGTGMLGGFNVDMMDEIARILGAKTNVEIMKIGRGGHYEISSTGTVDMFIFNSMRGGCETRSEVPVFFLGQAKGWQKICIPDADIGVQEAVKRILDYLDETGIYARLYRTYFYTPFMASGFQTLKRDRGKNWVKPGN